MVVVMVSCSPSVERSDAPDAQPANSDVAAETIDKLIDQLGAVAGEFTDDVPPRFSHKELFLEIAAFGEDAVRPLVECFADDRSTPTTYRGEYLRLGHLCMTAFRYVAYHEAVDEYGDIDGAWIGSVGLTASVAELRQAGAAWRAVIDAGQYVVYPNL